MFYMLGFLLILFPHSAAAYVGPGAGISAIGSLIALVGAVLLAVVGFIWYPVKRILSQRSKNSETKSAPDKTAENISEPAGDASSEET